MSFLFYTDTYVKHVKLYLDTTRIHSVIDFVNCILCVVSLYIIVAGGQVEKDDIHLLLEYSREAQWGVYETTRANR